MNNSTNISLFCQSEIAFNAIDSKSKIFFSDIKKLETLTEIKLEEDMKAVFIIDSDYFLKERMFIREITVTLAYYSIILIYENEQASMLSKEKESLFNAYLLKQGVTHLINKVLEREYREIVSSLNEKKKLDETNHFKNEVLEIGTKIGSEKDTNKLLNEILFQSMKLVKADAGSLAVLGFDKNLNRTHKNMLTFYASKNISREIHFSRFSLKVSNQSLAGYAVMTREALKIDDVYKIDENEVNYSFNKEFDRKTKFRTKSILVIPMINSKDEVMGVIQLINKKKNFNRVIDYEGPNSIDEITNFDKNDENNIKSLASFLTVSLENAMLYNEIDELFNSFVEASVSAVEQRDPVTSGHSFRVASYSVNLAKACSKAGGVLEEYHFNPQQIRELRYASLLHDFGKIGVRENVLVKSKKLSELEIKDIFNRIDIYIYHLKLKSETKKMNLIIEKKLSETELKREMNKIDLATDKEVKRLLKRKDVISQSNVPTILEKENSKILEEIKEERLKTDSGELEIINEEEFNFLSIPRGNLSNEERLEIQSHVTHTFNFLKKIPWTKDLGKIPEIAYGHHEKLDGTGYPLNKKATDILPQTKIMTICDIFDALTAADRPYKKAISKERAIEILYLEANENKIEKNLVDYFIKSKSHVISGK